MGTTPPSGEKGPRSPYDSIWQLPGSEESDREETSLWESGVLGRFDWTAERTLSLSDAGKGLRGAERGSMRLEWESDYVLRRNQTGGVASYDAGGVYRWREDTFDRRRVDRLGEGRLVIAERNEPS